MSVKAPILIFAYGNVSRGDDGLGPLLLERIESHIDPQKVELLCDFQLQIEHALDLEGRRQFYLPMRRLIYQHLTDSIKLTVFRIKVIPLTP